MQNRKRDTDVQNRLLDSVGEGEDGMIWENSIETCILSRVKQITSPGWMHETSARGWCTGKTQRDWVEREAGEGIWMGNTCKSMADSCQCMTKTTIDSLLLSHLGSPIFCIVLYNTKSASQVHYPFVSSAALWEKWTVCVKLLQLCLTLCNSMDYSLPGSSFHGIL